VKGLWFGGAVAFWSACTVLVAAAFIGPVSASASAVPPEGPWLAFPMMYTLWPASYSVKGTATDGSGRVLIARGSRRGIAPNPFSTVSWSPDGAWLAFAGFKGPRKGIYELRPDGTGMRFLRGTEGGRNPILSPDGSKLAFVRDNFKTGATTTWVADADGRKAVRLPPRREGVEYLPSSFSPDGSVLAVTRKDLRSNRSWVLLFGLDGRPDVRVLARGASEAVFSPDGSQIALVRETVARHQKYPVLVNKDLYVMSADGTSNEVVTPTRHLVETHPSWDPSGQRIAFNSYHLSEEPIEELFNELLPFGNSIMDVNADGSCKQKILSLKNGALRGPAWRPGPGREARRIEC
jgi:Tol biopolymer transport system component